MIPIPKPKVFERKKPPGQSMDDYIDDITMRQSHFLQDAIDRVSPTQYIPPYEPVLVDSSVCYGPTWHFHVEIRKNSF